ncbi:MAG: hypothetical protein L0Y56_09050, partial [Nitrospira sp.]|nr:hypothetical protein [Nitrospira sp.]
MWACNMLGLEHKLLNNIKATGQSYSKILPTDNDARREFMHWATKNHNVYSLGRFATWRPGLLLDDLVQDVRLISKWIHRQDHYEVARVA